MPRSGVNPSLNTVSRARHYDGGYYCVFIIDLKLSFNFYCVHSYGPTFTTIQFLTVLISLFDKIPSPEKLQKT